jgi:hypothetical protein
MSAMAKDLQKYFQEINNENIQLWCEILDFIEVYDSPEMCVEIGQESFQNIHNQASQARETLEITAIEISEMESAAQKLREIVEERIANAQTEVLKSLENQASTIVEEGKVEQLATLNKESEPSIFQTIQRKNKIKEQAIPMIFAVLSRRNDYYGLGTMGPAS